MNVFLSTCLLIVLSMGTSAVFAYETEVVGVLDGDTIDVMDKSKSMKSIRIRLNGIDCPEKKQAFGMKAKEYTSQLCFGKTVNVEGFGKDRYGRIIGEITLKDGRDLNRELVRAGLAWWFKKYAAKNIELQNLEDEARKGKRGLWVDETPIAPWDFRHKH